MRRLRELGAFQLEIAALYDVSDATVSKCVRGILCPWHPLDLRGRDPDPIRAMHVLILRDDQGLTIRQIATRLGVSKYAVSMRLRSLRPRRAMLERAALCRQNVLRILADHPGGFPVSRMIATPTLRATMRRMRKAGTTLSVISRHVGMSIGGVKPYVNDIPCPWGNWRNRRDRQRWLDEQHRMVA